MQNLCKAWVVSLFMHYLKQMLILSYFFLVTVVMGILKIYFKEELLCNFFSENSIKNINTITIVIY